MVLTWQDVKELVEIYEHFEEEEEEEQREWYMDEDQTGIPYPHPATKEDLYRWTATEFNKRRT